ncbi:MAG: sulfotransferase domain-containing protein [bacterium]
MITIVSGLPRSGTSMMMRILEAGGLPLLTDQVRVADVDNPNGYCEFEPVKTTADDSSWLAQAEGRVVKMVYKLLYDLPANRTYHVVFLQRALKEVVASQNRMLAHRRANEGVQTMGQSDSLTVGLSDRPTVQPALDEHTLVEAFAAEVAACKAWLRCQPNFQVLYVNYNQLLDAPQAHVAKINAFLGGQWNEAAMCQVVDPKLYRERRT